MATFTYVPDFPASESSAPRVNRNAVPSYEQRTTFGIFEQFDTWDLTFSARTATERDDIYAFLEGEGGTTPFTWETPFGETASFVCSKWDTTLDSCNLNTVRASFESQYLPGGPNFTTPAAPTTAFSYVPEFAAQHSYDSNAQVTNFGDGYRQRITFGLQPQQEEWRLTFSNRSNAERDLIRAYLRGAKGVDSFLWTDPRSTQTVKFVCAQWNVEYSGFNNNEIQATFRRVYEP